MIKSEMLNYFVENVQEFVHFNKDGFLHFKAFGRINTLAFAHSLYKYLLSRRSHDSDYHLFIQAKLRWAAHQSLNFTIDQWADITKICRSVWNDTIHDSEMSAFTLFIQDVFIQKKIIPSSADAIPSAPPAAPSVSMPPKSEPPHAISAPPERALPSGKRLNFHGTGSFKIDYSESDTDIKFSLTCSEASDIQISINQESAMGIKSV